MRRMEQTRRSLLLPMALASWTDLLGWSGRRTIARRGAQSPTLRTHPDLLLQLSR